MSARVFSRLVMSQDPPAPRDPCPPELERVRRVLFGPVDRSEFRQFAEQELQQHRDRISERYNFDFVTFAPRNTANSRYQWTRVDASKERVPDAYAMERLPFISMHADSQEQDSATEPVTKGVDGSTATMETTSCSTTTCNHTRQSSITDYMRKRKSGAGTSSVDSDSDSLNKKRRTSTSVSSETGHSSTT